ncbi:MAG: response regulator [Planctomycetes bacterium]|nr:response regulator [Planctomycetota bacterium]
MTSTLDQTPAPVDACPDSGAFNQTALTLVTQRADPGEPPEHSHPRSHLATTRTGKQVNAAVQSGRPSHLEPVRTYQTDPSETRAHILVVDDDPTTRKLLEDNLARSGYEVTSAASGAEAKGLAQANPPDLILTDVYMSGTDGIELTRWLRTQKGTEAVPIVLLSGSSDNGLLAHGLDAGADDFVTKPVNSSELRNRLRLLLRNKRVADELQAREQAAIPFGFGTSQVCSHHESNGNEAGDGDTNGQGFDTSGASILVIEDQRAQRALVQAFLGELKCHVHMAADGREALALLSEHRPDLVILDLHLPDIHGFDLIPQIKRRSRLKQVPILVVSAAAEVGDRVKALELGADDYIVKGFDRLEFKARVTRLLRWKRRLDHLADRCDQAMQQAMTDSLTGLSTHGFMREMLRHKLAGARRQGHLASVVYADIDHFKQINDQFGHASGDRVLKAVAQTLRESIQASDTVARFGGDEFVLLLPDTDAADAGKMAERARAAVESLAIPIPGAGDRDHLRVTMTLGVASYPADAADAECLLQRADEALYAAKQAGRNRVSLFNEGLKRTRDHSRVLLVDDDEGTLRLLQGYLSSEGYQTSPASDGMAALEAARRIRPDLILLDGVLPGLHGFDVCRRLKKESRTCLIPVILVSVLRSHEDKLRGTEAGADDFLTKPVDKEQLLARMRALLRSKRTTDLLEDAETVIFTLARAVESRDPSTGGHVERVSHYAVELGKAIGLPGAQVEGLRRAGVVHDIGKVIVPDNILLKPGKLTPEERKVIEQHVEVGYELLQPLRTFADSLPAVRFHHERLDGSGYPLGLKGDQVPVVAQIMAIVDVYDALTTDRVYRAALSQADACRILREEAARGLHEPHLLETFIRLMNGGAQKRD